MSVYVGFYRFVCWNFEYVNFLYTSLPVDELAFVRVILTPMNTNQFA